MFRMLLIVGASAAVVGSAHADLVAHWKFDESRGTVAHDSAGTANGTLTGDATFVPGVAGNAVKVSTPGNGLVNLGDVFNFEGNATFSISFWMRTSTTNSSTNEVALGRHAATVPSGYIVFANVSGGCYGDPQRLTFYQTNQCGGEITGTTTVTDMQWHHVTVVHNAGGQSYVYVDGAPAEGSGPSTGIIPVGVNLLVGGVHFAGVPTNLYNGLVDDLQIYDVALTNCDVDWLKENPGQSLPPSQPEDLNDDGKVDGADLGVMLGAWGPCNGCNADVDCDGTVGGADLARVLGAWTG
jgi:hypothetical protein